MIVEIDGFLTKDSYEKFVDGLISIKEDEIYDDFFSKEESEDNKYKIKVTIEAVGEKQ